MANYAKIKNFDIANGKGIRTSIFFSGCEFHCPGCFNSECWDFNVGESFNREIYEAKIKPTINEHIAGMSLLGGECLHPKNIFATCDLIRWFKEDFPDKNIWLWTGYLWEDLQTRKSYEYCIRKIDAIALGLILNSIDVLVDGQFVEAEKDLTLAFRGSRNQRVIDVQQSLQQGQVVLYKE